MCKCIPTILVIITAIFFSGCLNSRNAASQDKTEVDIFSEEYYNSAANNLERLQRLISGVFVFYHEDPDSKEIVKWDINEKNDSIMGYALPVGDVNKHGYWIYNVQFMTSIPNNPVYSSFVNLVQKSRDTIAVVFYQHTDHISPARAFQEGAKAFQDIRFDQLTKTIELVYIKENNLLFKGASSLHRAPRKGKHGKYQIDYYEASIKQTKFFSTFYPTEEKIDSQKYVGVNQYMYKIDTKKSPIVKVLKEMEIE